MKNIQHFFIQRYMLIMLAIMVSEGVMCRALYHHAWPPLMPEYVDFDQSSNVSQMVFGAYGVQDHDNYVFMKSLWNKNNFAMIEPSELALIPQISFHIWLGDAISPLYIQLMHSWLEKHPRWHHIFCVDNPKNYQPGCKIVYSFEQLENALADENLYGKFVMLDTRFLPLTTRTLIEKSSNFAQKSDIMRYELLYRYGGVYADTDVLCLKPFDIVHHCYTFYTGLSNTSTVELANGLIGAAPRHPLLRLIVETITVPEVITRMDDILNSTGPRYFTKMFIEYVHKNTERIIAFPCSYFYPTPQWARTYSEQDMDKFIQAESFTNHYWECSWWKAMKRAQLK